MDPPPPTAGGYQFVRSLSTTTSSSLSERIEALDRDTRACWGRVDESEDEEALLNQRLMGLERVRRRKRIEVLHLEQSCKASEMSMLEAEVDAAELNMKSQALKSLLEEASGHAVEVTENTAASAGSRGIGDEDYDDIDSKKTLGGSASLIAVLGKVPPHEERQRETMSSLQEQENTLRSEIADAARSAAELRRSEKKREAEVLSLERETSALREELASTSTEVEVERRMARSKHLAVGLRRRLQHGNEKLASVRSALEKGPAKQLEEEEKQSLALLRDIAAAKEKLHAHDEVLDMHAGNATSSRGEPRAGGGRASTGSYTPRRQVQSRGNVNSARLEERTGRRSGYHDKDEASGRRGAWG